jgi:deoxyxylulose-5-phosphate synthase
MAKTASTPTRVSADVFEAATSVAAVEHRTATEQVNYWARIGMQIERSGTLAHRKVVDVAAGRAQFAELTGHDRQVAHALVDAAIAERVASARFGTAARAEGKRTVSLDENGTLIEIGPDGVALPL